jgi:hypothetical protein
VLGSANDVRGDRGYKARSQVLSAKKPCAQQPLGSSEKSGPIRTMPRDQSMYIFKLTGQVAGRRGALGNQSGFVRIPYCVFLRSYSRRTRTDGHVASAMSAPWELHKIQFQPPWAFPSVRGTKTPCIPGARVPQSPPPLLPAVIMVMPRPRAHGHPQPVAAHTTTKYY